MNLNAYVSVLGSGMLFAPLALELQRAKCNGRMKINADYLLFVLGSKPYMPAGFVVDTISFVSRIDWQRSDFSSSPGGTVP